MSDDNGYHFTGGTMQIRKANTGEVISEAPFAGGTLSLRPKDDEPQAPIVIHPEDLRLSWTVPLTPREVRQWTRFFGLDPVWNWWMRLVKRMTGRN
jgi:hypothetical protein